MFILKNINKKYLFFFLILIFFIFWPKQTVFAICCDTCDPANCIEPDPADNICGDGFRKISGAAPLEQCDDENNNPSDGCSATCRIETGWYCRETVSGGTSFCYRLCGDQILNPGEICDWGEVGRPGITTINGGNGNISWCSSLSYANPPQTCVYCHTSCQLSGTINGPHCGDGIAQGTDGEACDDSNTTAGDGCSANCQTIEPGYTCPPTGGACYTVCGDGVVAGTETCDQGYGNVANGDGCSSTCQEESNWNCIEDPCNGTPLGPLLTACLIQHGLFCQITDTVCIANTGRSFCDPVCGDGVRVGAEPCDDGNTTSNDGCAANCTTEDGWSCTGAGVGSCDTICGDTKVKGNETCDDGNLITEECAYGLRACRVCSSSCREIDGETDFCGDTTVDLANGEGCDYDSQSSTRILPIPHNDDGCDTTCKVEPGWTCFYDLLNRNVCVYHCGNEIINSDPLYGTEDCDYGAVGNINPVTKNPPTGHMYNGTPLFNGDECTATNYGETCEWCARDCTLKTSSGPYCGEGNLFIGNQGAPCTQNSDCDSNSCVSNICAAVEECDDGNVGANHDGCINCRIEPGWKCKGLFYSSCDPVCGDHICVNNASDINKQESCVSCSVDCISGCSVQRSSVATAHQENMFVNFFEKLKSTFVRPTLLIGIPGLEETKPKIETLSFPPPVQNIYDVNIPTPISIGDQNYTLTVFAADPVSKTVTFSIK